MNTPGAKAYRPWTPELYAHQAHAPSAKLPEDDLVFFLIDVVPKLDLSKIHAPYQDETRGAPPFDPAMMVCLLLYSYCVGVFSSRKVARACERNLAFLAIVGEERPDFRTISPKFQGRNSGIPKAVNYLCQIQFPVSGYILINRSASACSASASVTWKNVVCLGSPATTQLLRQRVPR
jgi:transposase